MILRKALKVLNLTQTKANKQSKNNFMQHSKEDQGEAKIVCKGFLAPGDFDT